VTQQLNAAVTAAGRLAPQEARRYGTAIKALVSVGGRTLLARLIDSLRDVPEIGRITVVGPTEAKACGAAVDLWLDERETGEENLLAALRGAGAGRLLVSAHSIGDLLRRTPADVDCAYPIFTRTEFEKAFPGGRSSFARLADGEWTGGSTMVLNADLVLRNERLLRRAFAARKNLTGLALLLGPALALRFATGRLCVRDIQKRIDSLTGGSMIAIRGADPALAMDCDSREDFAYAESHPERLVAT